MATLTTKKSLKKEKTFKREKNEKEQFAKDFAFSRPNSFPYFIAHIHTAWIR